MLSVTATRHFQRMSRRPRRDGDTRSPQPGPSRRRTPPPRPPADSTDRLRVLESTVRDVEERARANTESPGKLGRARDRMQRAGSSARESRRRLSGRARSDAFSHHHRARGSRRSERSQARQEEEDALLASQLRLEEEREQRRSMRLRRQVVDDAILAWRLYMDEAPDALELAAAQQQQQQRRLSRVQYREGMLPESQACCAVCLTDFTDGVALRRLHCGHHYHPRCVNPWLRSHGTCPQCKRRNSDSFDH